MLGGVQRSRPQRFLDAQVEKHARVHRVCRGPGDQPLRRHLQRHGLQHLAVGGPTLVPGDLVGDLHLHIRQPDARGRGVRPADLPGRVHLTHPDLGGLHRPGEPVRGLRVHRGHRLRQRQLVDHERLTLVDVHCTVVDLGDRPGGVDGAEDLAGGRVDDEHLFTGAATDVHPGMDARRGVHVGENAPRPAPQQPLIRQLTDHARGVHVPAEGGHLAVGQRGLCGRTEHVVGQDIGVRRVEDARLDRMVQQVAGVVDEVGVHRVVGGHHDHQATLAAASGTTGLLPETRHSAGETAAHDHIEAADVDAELQRAGRRHAQQITVVESFLQHPAGLRGVARPVGRDAPRVIDPAQPGEVIRAGQGGYLRAAPGAHEGQCARTLGDGAGHDRRRLGRRRPAHRRTVFADGVLQEPRLPQGHGPFTARGAVLGHCHGRTPRQSLRLPSRIRGRRTGQDNGRTGTRPVGQPQQPAQHQGHVRAEDAPVDVTFVDDEEAQVAQQARPPFAVAEDRGVHHVRVGDDDACLLPDQAAGLARGVAVIGGDHGVLHRRGGRDEACQRLALVLGQSLRRRQVQAGRQAVVDEGIGDGQLVAQRLAGRCACRDDDIGAVAGVVRGGDLV